MCRILAASPVSHIACSKPSISLAQSPRTRATLSAFLSKQNFVEEEWSRIKRGKSGDVRMSDSPVESVWRDVFVDELPFSSEVDRAVQLQRYERKGGKQVF